MLRVVWPPVREVEQLLGLALRLQVAGGVPVANERGRVAHIQIAAVERQAERRGERSGAWIVKRRRRRARRSARADDRAVDLGIDRCGGRRDRRWPAGPRSALAVAAATGARGGHVALREDAALFERAVVVRVPQHT